MKVLLISHTCQSRTEGQPRARWLGREVQLKVLTPARWQHYGRPRAAEPAPGASFELEIAPVRWPWLPGAQSYLHHYPGLRRLLRTWQPDVIDLWEEPWALVSVQACWLRAQVCPRACLISETEQNLEKTLPFPFEQFRRYVLRQSDFLVGRSEEAIEIARRKGYRGPAEMVPNGVDGELFRPLDRARCRREVLGERLAGAFVAGYVGRLVPEKGLADLLEALPGCPPETHLVFVGEGPLRDTLAERAQQLGLAERVHLLPAQPLEALPAVMNALDVLVLPSRTTARWKEQFGRVIIEAHCCGTPVVGSDSGAIPDVVGQGGLIFPEGDSPALARVLTVLAARPEYRQELGAAGQAAARQACTWEKVAARMAAICRRLADA